MRALTDLRTQIGTAKACEALSVPRSSFYRRLRPEAAPKAPLAPPLALNLRERQHVIDLLHSQRFADDAPRQVYAALLGAIIESRVWANKERRRILVS